MDLQRDIRTRQVCLDRARYISEYAFDGPLNNPESDDDVDPGEVPQERWTPRHRAIFGLPDPDFQTGPFTDAQAGQPSENCLIPCSNDADVSMTGSAPRGVDASAGLSPKVPGDKSEPLLVEEIFDWPEVEQLTSDEFEILEESAHASEDEGGVGVYHVIIRGHTAQEALAPSSYPVPHPLDPPASHPLHEEHHQVSWIWCVYLGCPVHAAQKKELDVYPARVVGGPVPCLYGTQESFLFDRVVARKNGYVMLRRS